MDFNEILKDIKEKFSPRKFIDFEKEKFHFEVEPLNSMEEMVILGSLQDIENNEYLEALKRHTLACAIKKINDMEIKDEVTFYDDERKEKTKSRFLFMKNFMSGWPSALIDILFEAYTNMLSGIQKRIRDNAKFEKIVLSEKVEDEVPDKFHKVDESSTAGMTDTERLNKKVEEEINQQNVKMAQTNSDAIESNTVKS